MKKEMNTVLNTKLSTNVEDGRAMCLLCPRSCIISEGESGFCQIRKNINGTIQLSWYGQTSGFNIDPMEKKPLYHFYPGSSILSLGTMGCNLACQFCQNWSISQNKSNPLESLRLFPEDILALSQKYRCLPVAFTYNEPITAIEYVVDSAILLRENKIKTVLVSSGYINKKPARELFNHIDAANIDLKSINNAFYQKYTDSALKPVLNTLSYIREHTQTWLEITNLVIPGLNDSTSDLHNLSKWIYKNLGSYTVLHFSAFHPAHKLTRISQTSPDILYKAREIALSEGLRYIYCGNITDNKTNSTYCHSCKSLLIERKGYNIVQNHLTGTGSCAKCKTKIPGFFANP